MRSHLAPDGFRPNRRLNTHKMAVFCRFMCFAPPAAPPARKSAPPAFRLEVIFSKVAVFYGELAFAPPDASTSASTMHPPDLRFGCHLAKLHCFTANFRLLHQRSTMHPPCIHQTPFPLYIPIPQSGVRATALRRLEGFRLATDAAD
jgi:hypothetical protein